MSKDRIAEIKAVREELKKQVLDAKAPSAMKEIESKLRKIYEDSYAFSNTYSNRFFDSDNNYKNQYRTNTSDWLSIVGKAKAQNEAEANKIQKYLDIYKSYISEDSYKEISDILATNTKAFSDMYSFSENDHKIMSEFKNEDEYKAALAKLEEDEKMRAFDLEAGAAEIEALKAELAETRKEAKNYKNNAMPSDEYLKQETTPEARERAIREYQARQNGIWDRAASALEKEIAEKERYLEDAEEAQNAYKLAAVADPNSEYYDPEFERYAQMGEAIDNPSFNDAQGRLGDIQNPVKFTRENYNGAYMAKSAGNTMNGGPSEEVYGINHLYMEMTEDEYKTYNYYLAKDNENARRGQKTNLADEYINSLDLQDRYEDEKVLKPLREAAAKYPVSSSIISVATSLGSSIEYLDDIFTYASTGEMSSNLLSKATNTIRGTVSENVNWEIGNWDAFDFLYNTTMSGVDSLAAGTILGPVGGVVLGLSAAAQGTNDALERGMSSSQAFWNGLSAGVFEGLFESVSIGQFKALKASFAKGGKDIIKNIAKSMLVNASEEALTEIANITYDRIMNGDFSQYEIAVRKYMEEEGLSEAEAKNRVAREQAFQVVESGASGALMGFGFGATGSIANTVGTRQDGKAIQKEGRVDNLVELGKTFSQDSDAYELASKISKDSSASDIGKLYRAAIGSLSEQNLSDIKAALIEKGVSEAEAETLAKWMNRVVEGGTLTKKQQAQLESNEALAEVLYGDVMSSDSSVMQRGSLYNKLYGIASTMGIDRSALEETQTPEAITERMAYKKAVSDELRRGADPRRGLSNEQLAEIDSLAAKKRTTIPESNYQDVGQNAPTELSSVRMAAVEGKVSDTGKAFNKTTGEDVSIKGVASIDSKTKTMLLELADGTKVDSKNIEYESEKQAALYETTLQMGYDAHTANLIVHGYTASSPTSVENYLVGTKKAFEYGWRHASEAARVDSHYKALTPAEREYAYKVGEDARAADDKAREAKASQKQPQTAKKKSKGKYEVRLAVDEKSLTDRAKESVKALNEVAKALKVNIVVDNLKGNAYGYYNPSTNEIIIDANAGGKGKSTLLFTASHELVHYIRNWSPQKFTVLADFLMEQYAAKGEDIDALIKAEIDKAYKATRGKVEMTYDEAYEEVVAQAMQGFLTDSNFIERLAALQKKDANLAKRLISKLKEILNNIRAAYQGINPDSRASEAVKEMGEAVDELYAKMEEALIAASEASQTIGSRNLEDYAEAKNTEGKELFQYKAMEADEEAYRQMLKKHGIMSDADINRLFITIDKALEIIKNNLEVLDYAWEVDIDDRAYSPVKPNTDNLYKVSLDFSTLCRKRILQQVIQTQLQDALNKPISREESIAIRDELMKIQEEGRQIEIACALCYVESARMKSPAQIKRFIKNRESVIKEFLASKSSGDIKQKIAKAETDARNRLHKENPEGMVGKGGVVIDPRSAKLNQMTKKDGDVIREAKREAKRAYTPTAEEQKLIDAASAMTVTDFTSPEGLENLAKNYPVLFDAYTSYIVNATHSKGIEKDTWWRAGDSNSIGDTLIANMNRENGLRSQSWSDFQVIHMLDYIAATIELSTRNAKEQAYSKVPDYIELMGNTGVMLNMSLIPMAKFNGELEYDSVEGMAYKKALELRDKYHATAGTICIGISNEQIKMLLDDSSIDYVIPYHKSAMAAHIRKLMHIPTWSEYEKYQNETNLSRSEAEKQAKKYGVTLLNESDENYHKHTSFSEWFDLEEARQIAKQENAFPTDAKLQKKLGVMYGGYMAMQNAANNYLKLCAERGIAPKFSHENANFSEEANYWKLIIDRKMVDNVTGEIIEQQAIKPVFDEAEVLRILNDELERYPNVKADQDYAVRTVVEKFLSGEMNNRLDADTVAAIMQKPVDNITTTNIIASEEGVKAQYAEDNKKIDQNMTDSVIDLSWDNELAKMIEGETKTQKYKLLQKYIFDVLGGQELVLSDGRKAIVDKRDSQHLVQKAGSKKVAYLSKVKELIKTAKLFAYELDANHNKFNEFYYYKVAVKLEEDVFPIYVNVGKAKNDNTYHVYDITKKLRDSANLIGLEHPKPNEGYALKNAISNNNIPHTDEIVKGQSTTTDLKAQYADTDYAPTFYSQMGKVVEGVKQEKLAANSVVNMLRGKGVKAEEIRWSGIVQFLDGKKSVTKQELLDFINGSMLQVGEQSSSNDIDLRYDSSNHAYTHYDSNGNVVDTYTYNEFIGGYVSEASEEIYSNHYEIEDALREEYGEMSSPRWSEYKLEGGSNYREIVFTMPNSSYSNQMMRTHWGDDAEGVLAHARIQDFDVNGKKMLFVEEIQSDYHNEGHQSGYTNSETDAKINELKSIAEEKFFAVEDYSTEMTGNAGEWEAIAKTDKGAKLLSEYREAKANYDNAMDEEVKKIPDAPFKDTYHEFVMKRLLRMAAEEGYDSIGWTTADTQDKRWDDRQYHEEGKGKSGNLVGYTIEYDQGIPKFLRKYGRQWDARVGKTTLGNSTEVWSMDITDSMKNSVLYEGQAMYQYKGDEPIDNRTLLARSLEGAAKNDVEKTKLKEYQKKIELINAEEKKLRELRGQIKEISFSKGARDTEKLKKLQFEANQAANRINVYDKQLLRLEATKPLMDVLQREKDLVRKKMDKERKEAVRKAKEKDMATIREIMNRNTESRKKAVEGRNKTQMRQKIKGIISELDTLLRNPTAKKHIKEELRKEVANALLAINMDTVGADERVAKYNYLIAKETNPDVIAELTKTRDNIQLQGDNLKEKLNNLQSAYEKIKDTDDIELNLAYQEVIRNSIKAVSEKVGDTSIRNMSLEQLEMVYDLFKMIRHTIRDANKSFKAKKGETITQMAEVVNEQVRTVGGQPYKRNAINANLQRIGWTFLKPFVAFRTIGSVTLTNMYKELRNGEDTFYGDVVAAQAFIEAQYDKHGYKSWDMKKTKTFTAKSGKTFDLTLEQMMSLYAYSRREQAYKHIIDGGIVFEDALIVEKTKTGIPIKYEVTTKDAFNLSEETFSEIANSLSAEQKAFVDEMQAYLSDTMGEKGNEVSMELLGVKLFKEKFYLPIKSSQDYMNFKAEEAGEVKLKSPAFSKETVKHANNPIVIHNFTDLWAEHINDMSMYHSFVLALEDFTRVYNYKTKTDSKVETTSTKATLETAYPGVTKYINKFLKDMNGGVRSETVGWAEKLTSLAKKGAVLGSLSVAIQQPSAVMRAMAIINPKHFATTTLKSLNLAKHKQDWTELKKYAPIAGIKEMGRFDVGMGQGTVDWIQSNKNLMEKGEELLSVAPAFMDEVSWVSIWNAVKRETAHKNPKLQINSEEHLKLAGERFTEVISLTQVYDSVFSRSDIMRNKSWIAKALTSFMAEPTTTLNLAWDSCVQAKRSGSAKGYVKATVTTGGAIVAATVLNAALKSIVMAIRDDDEDESYLEKYLEHFIGDLKDNLNPLNLIPFVKDIVSIFNGYDVERMDMALISDLKNAIDAFDSDSKTEYEKWSGLIGAISAFFGVPVKNVERDIRGLITTVFGKHEQTTSAGLLEALKKGWTGEETPKSQRLYDAILSGDTKQIGRMKAQFKDDKAIQTALRKALRENDERISEAAQARLDGNAEEYKRIAREIVAEGHFTQDDVVAAINAAMKQLDEDVEEETPEEEDKATSYFSSSDINAALENGDAATALKVIDDIVQVKTENYISDGYKKSEAKKKAEASVKSSVSSYWKPLYLEAKESKNLAEVTRIKNILKATKLYDNVTKTTDDWWVEYKKTKK